MKNHDKGDFNSMDENPWDEFEIESGHTDIEFEDDEDTDIIVKASRNMDSLKKVFGSRSAKVAAGLVGILVLAAGSTSIYHKYMNKTSENETEGLDNLNLGQGIEEILEEEVDDGRIGAGSIDGIILGDGNGESQSSSSSSSSSSSESSSSEKKSIPELTWTGSYNAEVGTTVTGPALIEKDGGWIRLYAGENYTLQAGGHVNTYTGNSLGLDVEYSRLSTEKQKDLEERKQSENESGSGEQKQETPELSWTGSHNATAGTSITGPALIETDSGWIKVGVGQTHTLSTNGHVNTYEGNSAGLDAEYSRVQQEAEKKDDVVVEEEKKEEVPELSWTGSHNADAGTTVTGPALIETDSGWIRIYVGENYTLEKSGHVNKYDGNNSGLDAEYKRVTSQ